MATELKYAAAVNLAASLVTIGHPYQQAAINATAWDLVKWCHGVAKNPPISAEQQAQMLINRVRETWEEWPERGGTKKLRALFCEMFEPSQKPAGPEFQPYVGPSTIDGEPLPPYCLRCDDTGWESYEVNGNTYAKLCSCGRKRKPAQVCANCGGKETRFENGRRVPCPACLTPERRQQIADFLNSARRPS